MQLLFFGPTFRGQHLPSSPPLHLRERVRMSRIAEFVRQLSHGLAQRVPDPPVPPPHEDDGQGGADNILCEAPSVVRLSCMHACMRPPPIHARGGSADQSFA